MSRNNVGMMIATLESQLNYIFSELPEKVFFTEAEIHDQYNEQTGDNLDDKLRRVNMNLGEFMTQRFFEKFNVVSGPDNNGFMRRDFLRSLAGGSAIAASNGTSNGTSRTSPPNTNGIGFSTSIQSSFPASPPVVPQATRFSPPGLGNLSSNNSQRLVDQRMDKLQKQFSDRGFEGVFHPDVLKHHFGDLSELLHLDEENKEQFEIPLFFKEDSSTENHRHNNLNGRSNNHINGSGAALLNNNANSFNIDLQRVQEIWSSPNDIWNRKGF